MTGFAEWKRAITPAVSQDNPKNGMPSNLTWVNLNHRLRLIIFAFNIFSRMSYLCQSSLGTSEPFSKVTGKPSSFLNLLSCFIIPQSWTDDAIFFFNLSSEWCSFFSSIICRKKVLIPKKSLWTNRTNLRLKRPMVFHSTSFFMCFRTLVFQVQFEWNFLPSLSLLLQSLSVVFAWLLGTLG